MLIRFIKFAFAAAIFSLAPFGDAQAQSTANSWTGYYFGAGVSFEHGKMKTNGTATTTTQQSGASPVVTNTFTPKNTEDDFDGQIFTGYRVQNNAFVGGVEAMLNLDPLINFSKLGLCNIPVTVANPTSACATVAPFGVLRDYGRLRALGGYLVNPDLLAFLSLGAAFGQGNAAGFRTTASLNGGASTTTQTSTFLNSQKNFVGLTLGGGLEGRFNDRWSIRAEYIYDRFPGVGTPTVTNTVNNALGGAAVTIQTTNGNKVDFSEQSALVSVIYKY